MSEFFTAGRILDILLLLLLVGMTLHYVRSGFVAGVLDFFGTLLSIGAAWWGAKAFSSTLFEKLFRDNLVTRTANVLSNSQGVLTVNEIVHKISGFLPQNIIDTFLGQHNGAATFDMSAKDVAQRVVEEVIQPLVLPVISLLVFFVVFIVCRIIIRFIVAALKNINKIPVLGAANKALGAVSGFLVGLLYTFLAVCAVWALVIITGGDVAFFSEQTLKQSLFYGLFSGLIPFS